MNLVFCWSLNTDTRVIFLLAISGLCSASILAQSENFTPPVSSIVKVEDAPTIDGVLSDGEWDQAITIEEFHQVDPIEYGVPSERTEVYIMYDEDALYVAAKMFDSEPDKITARVLRQGESLRSEDRLKLTIDPYNDKRSGYEFESNANGVRGGGIYVNGDVDRNWEGIWEAKARITNFGWVAEYRIPFKTLSFDGEGDWGFNVTRRISRKNEAISWSSGNRQHSPAYSGTLRGLSGLSQGIGLDIVPSFSATQNRDYDLDQKDTNYEPSLDVFYKITPSINGSVTFNTDFSATEVDDRQVDLSRFSLFFPEKRSFFLRESDIFEFGGIGGQNSINASSRGDRENGRPYFSRRIGLGADGSPVDIDAGAKVTGRYGALNFGVMSLRQGEVELANEVIDATTVSVARVSANVLEESNLGFIVTDGDPRTNLNNTVFGLDFRYRNTRLAQGRSIIGDIWYQQSDTQAIESDNAAFGFSLDSPNATGVRGGFNAREIQENFNPALGFVSRSNVRQYAGQIGYTHRFRNSVVRSVYSSLDVLRVNVLGGGLQSENLLFRLGEFENNSGDELNFQIESIKENLLEDFEISENVNIVADEYSFTQAEVSLETAAQRIADVTLSYRFGDFYDGDIKSAAIELGWRPSKYLLFGASYSQDDVDLSNGSFTTKLVSAEFDVVFSDAISWVNLVQYDNVSETIGFNSRLQWSPKAGQNVYFVINQNYVERLDDPLDPNSNRLSFQSQTSDITLKIDYTFRF
ncbi:MAG: carbohydrate binding family 9 domain-containing protein [Acidiferrobacterales bacterium]|nr:carbohydrate binding family 9 domain-containing protein [Acidiferrobacterales bacterium]